MTPEDFDDPRDVSRDEVRAMHVPFDRIPFDHAHCFLCGDQLTDETATQEHIFPKWLQSRFALWNERLTLLNGTDIPYRQLTVPCCVSCNSGPLSRLEDKVRRALEDGADGLLALSDLTLFQWAAKLLFGIVFKEIALSRDRKDPASPAIFPPANLDEFATLHDLLQSLRVPTRIEGAPIFSVIKTRLHDLGGDLSFHFADSLDDQVVCLRLGDVGLIASLADAGLAFSHWKRVAKGFGGHPMHPLQFDEMMAHVVGVKHRMTRSVKLTMMAKAADGSDLAFLSLPIGGFSLAPVLREFSEEEHRLYLRHFLQNWGPAAAGLWDRETGVGSAIYEREGHVALLDREFNVVGVVACDYEEDRGAPPA